MILYYQFKSEYSNIKIFSLRGILILSFSGKSFELMLKATVIDFKTP